MGDVDERVAALEGQARADLERLVAIPSVSQEGFDPAGVRASAEATAELLEAAGATGVELLQLPGAHPAVYAEAAGPPGSPTVLLYAHHDVQPPGDEAAWSSPPFEPVERGGRLYGRGSCDDKCGVVAHTVAIRAFDGRPPVSVKVLIEGEEETGSDHLAEFIDTHAHRLAADVLVLADSNNWRDGTPALTTSLRGLVDCYVQVRVAEHASHSGVYGGPLPDALVCMARLLATLHDDEGNPAIPGLVEGDAPEVDFTEEEFRKDTAVLRGVRLLGRGTLAQRVWRMTAIDVIAVDAPRIAESANQVVPVARAKLSMRIAPGEDPSSAFAALEKHLLANAPWGAEVTIDRGTESEPFSVRPVGPAYDAARRAFRDAWGRDAVEIGSGGSIPFVGSFVERYPDAAVLLTGFEDEFGRAHGEDESIDLGEFRRACLAEALLLSHLAGTTGR